MLAGYARVSTLDQNPELRCQAEAMLRDRKGYPFVSDVIRSLSIGRTTFCHHFPKERIRELRG